METISMPVRRVDTLTSTLSTLFKDDTDGPHISIYQGAGRLPNEAAKARIRLKNNLQTARRQLEREGVSADQADALLAKADGLCSTNTEGADGFWRHQEGGLAIFINQEGTTTIPVGRPFDSFVTVSCQYHLKPLMALAANVDAYHLLTLSQNAVKLFRGSALGIREIDVANLPSSYGDAMDRLGYPADSFAATAAESHLKVDREHLKTFFKEVEEAVTGALQGSDWPLLVAGDHYYEPLYREVNHYRNLSEAYLEGNPEHMESEVLHRKASRLLKSDFIASQKRTLVRLAKVENPDSMETDLSKILAYASQGRIETLIVPVDAHYWGAYDLDEAKIHRSEAPGMGSVDLYETAARSSLENGGEVYFLQANQIPCQADLLAKLRW